jgi:hypothetical protein
MIARAMSATTRLTEPSQILGAEFVGRCSTQSLAAAVTKAWPTGNAASIAVGLPEINPFSIRSIASSFCPMMPGQPCSRPVGAVGEV